MAKFLSTQFSQTKLHQETKTHTLKITFKSEKSAATGHGFRLVFQTVPAGDWDPNKDDIDPIPIGTCGYNPVIASEYDKFTITSPGFPQGYEPNQNCIWRIASSARYSVEFNLQWLDMEVSHQCSQDWLRFYDGPTNTDAVLFEGCEGKNFQPLKIHYRE